MLGLLPALAFSQVSLQTATHRVLYSDSADPSLGTDAILSHGRKQPPPFSRA